MQTATYAAMQTTLRAAVTLAGSGAHGGRPARVTVSPAGVDTGVVFCVAGVEISAHWSLVDGAQLRTRLASNGASVSTVEHLMAALAGLGVDNVIVDVDGDEIPAMDGSAACFVSAIDEVGVVEQPAARGFWRVAAPVRISDGAGWAELRPAQSGLSLDVEIAFAGAIGRQRLALDLTGDSFRRELARARTFGFLQDAERLWAAGLALGASLDNTLVMDGETLLNPFGLRFADEFVRHKMLDVVGDLALAGAPIVGAFRSYRGGHGLNLALLRAAAERGALVWSGETAPRAGVAAVATTRSP